MDVRIRSKIFDICLDILDLWKLYKKFMEGRLPKLSIPISVESPKHCYLSPTAKRSLTNRSSERINFNKNGFSSPKCVRASHEMLIPLGRTLNRRHPTLDTSKSIFINNRRIGEKLLLDSFPCQQYTEKNWKK